VDVRRLVFRRLLAEQRPQPANDLGCPLGVGSDIGQRLPELSLIGGSTREHQASRLGVGGDRGQWLVDLVGQRACQRPQRRGAQGVFQPPAANSVHDVLTATTTPSLSSAATCPYSEPKMAL